MSKYTVDALSLSHIGDLLRDRLGDNASQYLFPDDFEKAIVNIGFNAIIVDGDSSPYDEIIFLGNCGERISRNANNTNYYYNIKYKKATFIGATRIAEGILCNQVNLENIILNEGIVFIGDYAFRNTTALNKDIILPSSVTSIGTGAFCESAITGINGENVTTLYNSTTNGVSVFSSCYSLKTVSLPKLSTIYGGASSRGIFYNCTSLETVQLGSIGHPVSSTGQYMFQNCTSPFTLIMYCAGTYANTALTNARTGATNATIIIKAAADTTYNGNSYSAGDTMITSTPT